MLGLLAVWRALGLDVILRECWEAGVVLAGLSRGRDVLVRVGRHDARSARPAPSPGLGFLPGSMSVHMDGEPARLPVCRASIADGTIPPGYAADDGVALLFRGTGARGGRQLAPDRRALRHRAGRREVLEPRLLAKPDRFGPTPEIAEFRRVRALSATSAGREGALRSPMRRARRLRPAAPRRGRGGNRMSGGGGLAAAAADDLDRDERGHAGADDDRDPLHHRRLLGHLVDGRALGGLRRRPWPPCRRP